MSYTEAWENIRARIKGLQNATELYAQYLISKNTDGHGIYKELDAQCKKLLLELKTFHTANADSLPAAAAAALATFIEQRTGLIEDQPDQSRMKSAVVFFLALEGEVTFHLSDNQELIRRRAERALDHLQRSIVVDPTYQERWKDAFAEGEVRCETLGALHLLWHGIYAFKVVGEGERTDLVYNEPIAEHLNVAAVEGVVLTEWKVAKSAATAGSKFDEAIKQAKTYSRGVMAGMELSALRYAIVVSEKQLPPALLTDVVENGIVYRRINIAVAPRTPSEQSKLKS